MGGAFLRWSPIAGYLRLRRADTDGDGATFEIAARAKLLPVGSEGLVARLLICLSQAERKNGERTRKGTARERWVRAATFIHG
jgi:hypothetical protein